MPPHGGTGVSLLSFEESKYKCCGKKYSAVYCIFCNSVYHIGCLVRAQGSCGSFIKIDERSVICCKQLNLSYKNVADSIDEERDIGNLKFFVKSVIAENLRLKECNDQLIKQVNNLTNNSCIVDMETSMTQTSEPSLWQERYLFTKKENDLLNDKNKLLEENKQLLTEKISSLMKKKLSSIENNLSYASVSKDGITHTSIRGRMQKQSLPPLNVKNKDNNAASVEQIYRTIKSKLDPVKDGFSAKILKARNLVKIFCEKDGDLNKIEELINTRTNEAFQVSRTKLFNPQVKVVNIMQNYTKEELAEIIRKQNNFTHEESIVNVKFIKIIKSANTNRKSRSIHKKIEEPADTNKLEEAATTKRTTSTGCSDRYTAHVELDPKSFNIAMAMKKIKIGWESCLVYEDFHLLRCFKCNGFGHTNKDNKCFNGLSCANCAGSHDTKRCMDNKKVCINCTHSNAKYKKTYNTEHCAYELKECEYYKSLLNQARLKINYDFPLI